MCFIPDLIVLERVENSVNASLKPEKHQHCYIGCFIAIGKVTVLAFRESKTSLKMESKQIQTYVHYVHTNTLH